MNVKLGNAAVRYKITQEELQKLLKQEALKEKIGPGKSEFTIKIQPCDNKKQAEINFERHSLVLYLPKANIKELFDMGRSKEGLRFKQEEVSLQIQVDIRPEK